jgi:hypothetical protein
MRALVRLRLPSGAEELLGPGDLIGRTRSAALCLDDPHVSEAHALVSLRGGVLKLLSLRRRILVDGQPVSEVDLAPGQRIALSPETELRVLSVAVPPAVLGLTGPGLPPQALVGTASLFSWPHLRLAPGVQAGAEALIWDSGEEWRLRLADAPAVPLSVGDRFEVGAVEVQVVAVSVAHASQDLTQAGIDAPVHIIARYDTVHLQRAGMPPAVLSGQSARVVSELVAIRAPVSWEELARPLWPEIPDRDLIRRRWDVLLVRLRDRLRALGVRPDLVRSSRNGLVELVLQPGDSVDDQT